MLIILTVREKRQSTQNQPWVSWSWVPGAGAASSCRAAPGSPGLDPAVDGHWTQERTDRNLGRHRRQDKGRALSRSQPWTKTASPSWSPALSRVWQARHGISRWPTPGPLFCLPLPARATLHDSSPAGPQGLSVILAAAVIIVNRGLFLHSCPTVSSVKL